MTEAPTLSEIPEDADQPVTRGSLYQLQQWIGARLDELTENLRPPVDEEQLTAAARRRRDEARRLNAGWEHADREVWDRRP